MGLTIIERSYDYIYGGNNKVSVTYKGAVNFRCQHCFIKFQKKEKIIVINGERYHEDCLRNFFKEIINKIEKHKYYNDYSLWLSDKMLKRLQENE